MPGHYSHEITVDCDVSGFKNFNITPPIALGVEVIEDINRRFTDSAERIEKYCNDGLVDTLATLSQLEQRSALAEKGSIITGALSDSILIHGSGKTRDVGTSLFYAQYVEDGRGPVRPVRAKALRFKLPGVGWVFAKSVGPAKPRYYLRDSGKKMQTHMRDTVKIIREMIY
ncbi:HK97 gp10 family phage protein [Methanosphaera sp.]